MNRKTFLPAGAMLAALVLLFLASSTDLIIKERQNPVYNISIIIDSADDEGWQNFKDGMDCAAVRYNADISFVTLYDNIYQGTQQSDLLQREISGGAQGVILTSEKKSALNEVLETVPVNIPIIVYGSATESPRIKSNVTPKWENIAYSLGEKVAEDYSSTAKVAIATVSYGKTNIETMCTEISNVLKDKGFEVSRINLDSAEECPTLASGLMAQGRNIVIAPELEVFEELSKAIGDESNRLPLYGVGWSGGIWDGVQKGYIKAAAVSNDYAAGYMCVSSMVRLIDKEDNTVEAEYKTDYSIITNDNLYSEENQNLLFPGY